MNKIVRENHLDFLHELYTQGIEIGNDNVLLLKSHNYISDDVVAEKEKVVLEKINKTLLSISTDKNKDVDSQIDIIEVDEKFDVPYEVITDKELEQRRQKYGHKFEGRKTEIQKIEWLPESTTEHTIDFINWINSIYYNGFGGLTYYRKFALYCQQAYTWLQENKTSTDFDDDEDREDFRQNELNRCAENTLYFLNKYVYYKEGDDESGKVKYVAHPVHEIIAFMDDSGYSVG